MPAPETPEEGYHLTEDLVDRAIEFIADSKQVAPDIQGTGTPHGEIDRQYLDSTAMSEQRQSA